MAGEDFILPKLREDITLIEGPKTIDGFPTWSLNDPVRNVYFRIGWLEFNLLSNWSLNEAHALIDKINQSTTLVVSHSHINNFIHFLQSNNLLELPAKDAAKQLLVMSQKKGRFRIHAQLRKYLFFKIRLIRPDKFLDSTITYVKFLFRKEFYIAVVILSFISLYLVSRQWEAFINTFWYFFNIEGLLYFIITILFVKIVHEFSHAYTAKYYGVRVTTIGFAIILFWPILYTDTTDAWRLTSRYKRMAVDAAGIISELVLAVLATFLWVLLPEGALRSAMFFVATTSWLLSLLVNLNPCIRFDGYYLFADWLNITNLQARAFALGKWRLREWLFDLKEIKPHFFSKKIEKIVLMYCYSTWVYRLALFSAISIFVYHFFFKLLGIILFVLIFFNFIIMPIAKELKQCWQRREAITMNKHTIVTSTSLLLLLVILIIPWQSSVHAPALLTFGKETRIYTAEAGIIENIAVKENEHVTDKQLLLVMRSPELEHKLQQTNYDIQIIKQRIKSEAFESERLGFRQADREELVSKQSEYKGLKEQQDDLTMIAPFTGEISYVAEGLKPGHWLSKNVYVLELINDSRQQMDVYIEEKDVNHIKREKLVTFYPNEPNLPTVKAKIVSIEKANTKELSDPYLASIHGGDIAVEKDEKDKLAVKESIYRVTLSPESKPNNYTHATAGTAVLTSKSTSLLYRAWVKINAVLVRESGF